MDDGLVVTRSSIVYDVEYRNNRTYSSLVGCSRCWPRCPNAVGCLLLRFLFRTRIVPVTGDVVTISAAETGLFSRQRSVAEVRVDDLAPRPASQTKARGAQPEAKTVYRRQPPPRTDRTPYDPRHIGDDRGFMPFGCGVSVMHAGVAVVCDTYGRNTTLPGSRNRRPCLTTTGT